jgi:excisionase family DNA binding protein
MSVTQVATILGISRAAVHNAIQQERLAAQRYGNVILVSREAVLRYRQQRAEGARNLSNAQAHVAAGTSSGRTLVAKPLRR